MEIDGAGSSPVAPPPEPPPPPPPAEPASAPASGVTPASGGGAAPAQAPASAPATDNPDVQAFNGRSDFTPPSAPELVPGLSVSGSYETRDAQTPSGPVQATAGRAFEGQIRESTERLEATPDGPRPYTTYQIQGSVSQYQKVNGTAGPVGAEVQTREGVQVSYEAKVPAGQQGVPNPFDPDTMAPGSSVTITDQALISRQYSASYNLVNRPYVTSYENPLAEGQTRNATAGVFAQGKVTDSAGVAIGVERLNEQTMRVSVGSVEGVKNEATFGGQAEVSGLARLRGGVTNERALTEYHLETRDFDLSSPNGRQAYQDFINPLSGRAGVLPDHDPANGVRAGTVDSLRVTNENSAWIDARFGSFTAKGGLTLSSADGTVKVTRAPDGSSSVQRSARIGDQGVQVDRTFGADGAEDVSRRRYTSLLRDLPQGGAQGAVLAFTMDDRWANSMLGRGRQDVQMTFTQADIDRLQTQARANPRFSDTASFANQIGTAEDPGRVAMSFMRGSGRDALPWDLANLAVDGGQAVPGRATMVDRDTGLRTRVP